MPRPRVPRPLPARRARSPTRAHRSSHSARPSVSTAPGSASAFRPRSSNACSSSSIASSSRSARNAICPSPASAAGRAGSSGLEMRAVQALGLVDLAEPQRDLGLEQLRRARTHGGVDAGREPLARDVEAQGELVDHLQRRHARAGLEAGDVRGGAAGEGELALRQAGALAGRLRGGSRARAASRCGWSVSEAWITVLVACCQSCCLTATLLSGAWLERMGLRPRGLSTQLGPKETALMRRLRTSRGCYRIDRQRPVRRRRDATGPRKLSGPAPEPAPDRPQSARRSGALCGTFSGEAAGRTPRLPSSGDHRRRIRLHRRLLALSSALACVGGAGAGGRNWAAPADPRRHAGRRPRLARPRRSRRSRR